MIGHTDHLGGAADNDHLSWRRAETIRAQVLALIACLQPNRRVEIAVVGIRQGALPSSPAPAAAPEKVN
ncbi:hypothetical protein LNV08_00405 [Paucibacter sp. TC2R-5]|uniref:hypothetical protein n=1 Tax=Paucibacter sp. TC2R-5 TaxID=2893555 RepID=UPI0021E4A4F4|nr:hypothetical protein [Paucibacter sp. TC2R-5]MCV2357436.1 hypothetical protein [Paucibacter sp. TC2R-5]